MVEEHKDLFSPEGLETLEISSRDYPYAQIFKEDVSEKIFERKIMYYIPYPNGQLPPIVTAKSEMFKSIDTNEIYSHIYSVFISNPRYIGYKISDIDDNTDLKNKNSDNNTDLDNKLIQDINQDELFYKSSRLIRLKVPPGTSLWALEVNIKMKFELTDNCCAIIHWPSGGYQLADIGFFNHSITFKIKQPNIVLVGGTMRVTIFKLREKDVLFNSYTVEVICDYKKSSMTYQERECCLRTNTTGLDLMLMCGDLM